MIDLEQFEQDLTAWFNRGGMDQATGIPDHVLAQYVVDTLRAVLPVVGAVKGGSDE